MRRSSRPDQWTHGKDTTHRWAPTGLPYSSYWRPLQGTDVSERIRAASQTAYQALIDAELTAVIGAGPWERTEVRLTHRNGSRPRTLSTTAGDPELAIPTSDRDVLRLAPGAPTPGGPGAVRRGDGGLRPRGVTRKVDDLVKALGGTR